MGVAAYSAERDEYSPDRLALVGELRSAIEQRELVVLYQPKATLAAAASPASRRSSAGPTRPDGLIEPDEFIPLAERTGLDPSAHALRAGGGPSPGRPVEHARATN